MPGYAQNPLGVAVDLKIEAVLVVDAGLLYIRGFVVLLGPERGILEVGKKKTELFVEARLNRRRKLFILADGTI
ncbi:MAG: hypothetical protein OXH92_12830 [Bryobacterales bacterium]|nr:hypothetical protein [Bryobacterales bacterium]